MNLIVCDCNANLCKEWQRYFKNETNVKVICDDFRNIFEYDCVVSPANSFGFMDGGGLMASCLIILNMS